MNAYVPNASRFNFSFSPRREIARWDTKDGRCQAVNPDGFFGTPTQLKVFNEVRINIRFRPPHVADQWLSLLVIQASCLLLGPVE